MKNDQCILEYLRHKLCCDYISDLRNSRSYNKAKHYFKSANLSEYTIEDLQYAFYYMCGVPSNATTLQEMRIEFLDTLKQKYQFKTK